MLHVNYFNSIDIVLEYGYEKLRDESKTYKEQVLWLCERILQLENCIHDGQLYISLNEAKIAADLAIENIKNNQ